MRFLTLSLVVAVATSFADGGVSCVDSDWTYDTRKSTVWKVGNLSVKRNGVAASSGTMRISTYGLVWNVSDLSSLRLQSRLGVMNSSTQCGVTTCYDLFLPGASIFLPRR